MLITLLKQWRQNGPYVDNNGQDYGQYWAADRWDFNTDTLKVVFTAFPNGGSFQQEENLGQGPPEDESLATDFEFYVSVAGATRTGWFHDGKGGVTSAVRTITATATVIGCNCWGTAVGIVDLTLGPDVPTGAYTYLWNDGVITADRTQLRAGNYSVVIRHESGAQLSLPVTVAENPRLAVIIDKTDSLVTLRVSGGVAPYTFAWDDDPAETTNTRANLPGGTYVCTITDAKGCETSVVIESSEFRYYFVRNPIALPLDAGNDYREEPAAKPGLTFVCQVLVEREYLSGEFELVGTQLEQPADRWGRTTFQVQELLAPELDYHVPAAVGPVAERATTLFRRFYLRYAQVWGEPAVAGNTTDLVQHYALLGGLSSAEAAARTWFNSYQAARKQFLTWEANDKPVFPDQPEFLYWQALESTASIELVGQLYYTDGTSQDVSLGVLGPVGRFEVYCFATGYAQLLAGRVPAGRLAQLKSWHVSVLDDNGNPVSEVRRYVLDRKAHPLRRYVLYANSLGGMNTFVATGEGQYDAELSGEQVELTRGLDYDPQRGDTAVLERELKPVLKLASGLRLGSAELLGLQELLLSRRVLLYNNGRWLAGYLKTKNTTLFDEGKPVPTLEVEFVLPVEQQFTPYLPPTPAGLSPNAVTANSGRL